MGSFIKDLESRLPKEPAYAYPQSTGTCTKGAKMAMKDASTTNVKHMIDFGAEKISDKSKEPSLCSKALSPLHFSNFGSDGEQEGKGLMGELQMFDFGMQTRQEVLEDKMEDIFDSKFT